jgi:hypothetical protein
MVRKAADMYTEVLTFVDWFTATGALLAAR